MPEIVGVAALPGENSTHLSKTPGIAAMEEFLVNYKEY